MPIMVPGASTPSSTACPSLLEAVRQRPDVADMVVFMVQGHIVEKGDPRAAFSDPGRGGLKQFLNTQREFSI